MPNILHHSVLPVAKRLKVKWSDLEKYIFTFCREDDDDYEDDRINFSLKSRDHERTEIRDKILRAEHGE